MTKNLQQNMAKVPLTPFEHYMLADDRPTHSMACHMRFWFTGRFIRSHFEEALRQILPQNPCFQMTIEGSRHNRSKDIFWIPKTGIAMPFLSWAEQGTPIDHPAAGPTVDLYQEIGLRFWLRDSETRSSTQTMMLVQFHHSVCDGIGLIQFIDDLLIAYGQVTGTTHIKPRIVDASKFLQRGNLHLSQSDWAARKMIDWQRTLKFFKSLAQTLSTTSEAKLPPTADAQASERIVLSHSVSAKFRELARLKNVFVNDLLLQKLFLTLAEWQGPLKNTFQKVRISLAMSLRSEKDETQSASNLVSMVFLDRSLQDIRSPELLATIAEETKRIKDNRNALTLIRVLRRLGTVRYLMSFFVNVPICAATAVLTNLGHSFAGSRLRGADGKVWVGNITLEALELLAPVRPKTAAAFAINYYAGQLSISVHYDTTRLTREQAQRLIKMLCDRIETGCQHL